MSGDSQSSAEKGARTTFPYSPYALEVSVGGSFEGRYRLRSDKPTWIGRRPHESREDFEYLHVPGSNVRWHCLFEWDAKAGRFSLTIRKEVWINGEDVAPPHPNLPKQPRLLNEGDVIVVSGVSRGPYCVRVALVRATDEGLPGPLQDIQAEPISGPLCQQAHPGK
jgi:hypothetical protein